MSREDDRWPWRDLLAVLVLQVVVLVAFQLLLPAGLAENESTDFTLFYQPVAERLADGHGLEVAADRPALRYPPGYPTLLAGAFVAGDLLSVSRDTIVDVFPLIATVVAGLLLHLIARRVFGRRHAWAASVLWLAYPIMLWTAKQPNSELPYMVVLYAGVLVLVPLLVERSLRWPRALGAGALFGLAATVRPAGLFLIPAAATVVALRLGTRPRREHLRVLGFLALAAAPIFGATAWMSAGTGTVVVLSDANEVNLVEGMTFGVDSDREADALPMPEGLRDWVKETHDRETELGDSGRARAHLGSTARQEPLVLVELFGYKALRAWYGTETFRFEGLLAVIQVCWLVASLAGAWCCRRRAPGARWYLALTGALLAAAWVAAITVLSIARYLLPTLGLLAPLAAVATIAAVDRLRGSRGRVTDPPMDLAGPVASEP